MLSENSSPFPNTDSFPVEVTSNGLDQMKVTRMIVDQGALLRNIVLKCDEMYLQNKIQYLGAWTTEV